MNPVRPAHGFMPTSTEKKGTFGTLGTGTINAGERNLKGLSPKSGKELLEA